MGHLRSCFFDTNMCHFAFVNFYTVNSIQIHRTKHLVLCLRYNGEFTVQWPRNARTPTTWWEKREYNQCRTPHPGQTDLGHRWSQWVRRVDYIYSLADWIRSSRPETRERAADWRQSKRAAERPDSRFKRDPKIQNQEQQIKDQATEQLRGQIQDSGETQRSETSTRKTKRDPSQTDAKMTLKEVALGLMFCIICLTYGEYWLQWTFL